MDPSRQSTDDLESLTALAKGFAERGMHDEASELFELALRFDPENLGLKLNLAQVRCQQRESDGRFRRDTEAAVRERIRRNAIDSAHFFGLAALYEERGKQELASECLEIARRKDLVNPYAHKLAGKIHFKRREFDPACRELRIAQRYNPFDREIAELLGRVEYERRKFQEAIEATIDAFLLLGEDDRGRSRKLIQRLRILKREQRLSSHDLVELFRERRDKLQTAFERLELQRERFLREERAGEADVAHRDPQAGRIELAARLRHLGAWSRLDEEEIFRLTQATYEERRRQGDRILAFGDDDLDIYVLEKGRIAIRRPTDYGNFELGTLGPGTVFGEANFISRSQRTADAVAVESCRLIRIDARELERLVRQRPDFGVKVYLSFWHGLSQKLRAANDELRTFFASERSAEELQELRRRQLAEAGDADDVDPDAKIRLFREQGLTGAELDTLSNFSQTKRFPDGQYLFNEGDEGQEMYVILDGKVMISKYIPGGGEEALAILKRGDCFGEMALIDGEPRSADAKAFQGPVTAVVFNNETLREVLSMDAPQAALDFMDLLCRLICKRLREIDEKVTGWRIMAGMRPEDEDDDQATADLTEKLAEGNGDGAGAGEPAKPERKSDAETAEIAIPFSA